MNASAGRLVSSPLTAAIIAFALTGGVASYLVHLENMAFLERQNNRVTARLSAVRSDMEHEINLNLASLYAFEGLVLADPRLQEQDFLRISAALTHNLPAVREIQLSPGGIVRYVYPQADAPKVVGLNLLTLPGQKNVVQETIASGRLRVAGPTQLVQGGVGLIARKPIYIGQGPQQRFWGFVTVLLDYPNFIQGIPGLSDDPDVEFAIRGTDGLGSKGAVFFGPAELFTAGALTADVTLPDGRWQVVGRPRGGWRSSPLFSTWSRVLAFLFTLGIALLTYVVRARGNSIRRIAEYDVLTGMLRRHAFIEKANEEIRRALRYKRPLSLLLFDVDHFKEVNDKWGHGGGDAALSALSKRVMQTLRPSDAVGRVGGEEFAVLCPETDTIQALAFAERLRVAVAHDPVKLGNARALLTISVGVVQFRGEGDSLQAMMTAVDKALYRAKDEGRNRVRQA